MEQSLNFIDSLDIKTDYLIVGCSGGPDSMCLLNLLHKNNYKVICAHVNHNIRKESDNEYKFVQDYCQKNDIIFEGLELPKNDHHNESYYRKKRYKFYKKIANKYKTYFILTAHHGDDLIETILMRITRGSHLKGYLGFQKLYYERGFCFLKPLIYYNKDEILNYCKKESIEFVKDKTNDEPIYTRNRYRHNVIPFLKKENRIIHLKYLQFSEELESASDFIDSIVEKEIKANYSNGIIYLQKFKKLHIFIQKKELETLLKKTYGDNIETLKSHHIELILNIINLKKNTKLDLPLNIHIYKVYEKLYLNDQHLIEEGYQIPLEKKTLLPNGDIIEIVENSSDTSNNVIRLNTKDINLPLYIRTRIDGDKIEIKNMVGTKKISKIFIDEKINPNLRDNYPILVDAKDTILWLPGLRKSKFDNEKNKIYDIILKYTKKGNN